MELQTAPIYVFDYIKVTLIAKAMAVVFAQIT